MVLFLMQEMPSKRKQVRKIKRSIRKNVQRAKQSHEKQSPNQDMMLKLMALFGNKSGAQPSMDPAKFLEQQETKALRDAEVRKLKLQAKQTKSDNAAANQQYRIDVAKADLDDAQRQALQNQELLEVEKQLNGIQGGIRNLNIQAEQARHQIKMNTKYGDLEAEKAKRDKLKTDLQNLRSSINYMAKDVLTPDNMAIFKHANSKIEQYINALNGLERDILFKRDTSRKQKLVEAKAAELETSLNALLDINQRLKFDIDQEKDTIKIGESRIKQMQDLVAENSELEHKLARTKLAAENAGHVWNRDENGKPIKVFDEKLLQPEVKPEDNKLVMKYTDTLKFLNGYLDNYLGKQDWRKLISHDFKGHEDLLRKYERDYWDLGPNRLEVDGKDLETFKDMIAFYKHVFNAGVEAYNNAEAEYNQNMIRNEAIRSLPMPTKTEVTVETITNLKARQNQLKEDIELNKHKQRYKKNLEKEYIDIINNINRLEAEVRNTNPDDVPEELLKDIATLKNKQHELRGALRRHDKQRQRVEDIQDKADDIQFNNNVVSQQLQETPRSKKTRDDAEAQAVQSMVEAKKQEELNQTRQMTHKSEQDKRIAQLTENAMHTEKAQELDDKIVNEAAKGIVAEREKQRLEELDRTWENTRSNMMQMDIQKQVNHHMQEHGSKIQDASTTLTVVSDAITKQLAANEQLRQDAQRVFTRFSMNPEELTTFNRYYFGELHPGLRIDEITDTIDSQAKLNDFTDFFTKYDNGEIQLGPSTLFD